MLPRAQTPEYLLLERALEDGAQLDKYAAARLINVHPNNAGRYIKQLRAAGGVYVHGWRHSGRGPYYPVLAAGSRPDAPKPGPREKLQRLRRRRNPWLVLFGQ